MMKPIARVARRMSHAIALLVLTTVTARAVRAQAWVTLGTNDTTVRRIALGTVIAVPMVVDMSNAAGGTIDSIASSIAWNPAYVTFDSMKAGSFGTLKNIVPVNTAGTLKFDASSATPHAETTALDVATLYFTTGQTSGGTRLSFTPTDASSGATHFPNGELVGWTQDICVALPGVWGDVDTSGTVTIIDAQQIARSVVGDTVVDSARVANNGDVNGDGEVDILDAQNIARYTVALSAPARINQSRSVPPTVQTLTINQADVTLAVGETTSLVATPFDANGFTIVGCQSSAWSTTDPTIVRVNPTGQITAVAAGTATITATSGSATKQSVVTVQ